MPAFTVFCLALKSAFAGFFAVFGALAALIVVVAFIITLLMPFIDGFRTAGRSRPARHA